MPKEIDATTLLKVRALARREMLNSRPWACDSDVEDFASWVVVKKLEGRRAQMKHFLIDYIRQNVGDLRSPFCEGQRAMRSPANIDDVKLGVPPKEIESLIHRFDGNDRVILSLFFKWELTMLEIADCMGLCESNISYRLKDLKGRINRLLKAEA